MNNRKIIFVLIGFVLVLLAAIPTPALASDAYKGVSDEIKVGDTFTLDEGETYEGNLFMLGGTVTLERNSYLNGTIFLLGSNLTVDGTINGSIVALGGVVELNDQGTVTGDINSAGAYLDIDPAATIQGDVNTGASGSFWTPLPTGVRATNMGVTVNPFLELLWFIFRTLLWALLAMLTVMFLPRHANRVAQAAVVEPWLSGGVGLLTAIIAPIVLVLLSLTIILIPLTFTAFVVLVVAWAFGVISLGLELGRRLAKVFDQTWHSALAAGIGTFALVLVTNGLDALIPCLGWIPKLIVGVLGLGSVLITFFGTRVYPIAQEIPPTLDTSSDDADLSQVEESSLSDQE
jgi:Polymer-forming cytoskeletal